MGINKKETYEVIIECCNCHKEKSKFNLEIPFGTRKDVYLAELDKTCPCCGCSNWIVDEVC